MKWLTLYPSLGPVGIPRLQCASRSKRSRLLPPNGTLSLTRKAASGVEDDWGLRDRYLAAASTTITIVDCLCLQRSRLCASSFRQSPSRRRRRRQRWTAKKMCLNDLMRVEARTDTSKPICSLEFCCWKLVKLNCSLCLSLPLSLPLPLSLFRYPPLSLSLSY